MLVLLPFDLLCFRDDLLQSYAYDVAFVDDLSISLIAAINP